MTRPVYCIQQGLITYMSETEFKKQYRMKCLLESERILDLAKIEIEISKMLLEESHKYD